MGDKHKSGGHHHHHHSQQQHHHHQPRNMQIDSKHGKLVVCYYGSWAVYRQPPAKFVVEDIDPTLCTHLIYSFAVIDGKTFSITSKDPFEDLEDGGGKGGYKRAVALKRRNPKLKVTIAIGGWNERAAKFSSMASSKMSRDIFIKSVLAFLNTHKFDGLDLDWEYPAHEPQGGRPQDKANFVTLVKELKEAFKPRNYILTAAIACGKDKLEAGYDLGKLNSYLDLIHVMSYDYHGSWDGVVGANAPLRASSPGDTLNVESTIKYLLSRGVSQSKLVLGVPFYGRTYLLQNPSTGSIEFGRTPTQGGFRGPLIQEDNFMGYNEICYELSNNSSKWTVLWDDRSSTPYMRNGNQVVSYDNTKSIAMKVKMAKDSGLAGIMVWSIETDDVKGLSKHAKYSNYKLLRTINHEIGHVDFATAKATNQPIQKVGPPKAQPSKSQPPKTLGPTVNPQQAKKADSTKGSTWPGMSHPGAPTKSSPSSGSQQQHTGKYSGVRK